MAGSRQRDGTATHSLHPTPVIAYRVPFPHWHRRDLSYNLVKPLSTIVVRLGLNPVPEERPVYLTMEVEREADGRFLAEVTDLPGVLACGATEQEAIARVQALALRSLADRLENGEPAPTLLPLDFRAA